MNKLIRAYAKASGLDVYGLGKDRENWELTLRDYTMLVIQDTLAAAGAAGDLNDSQYEAVEKYFGVEV